jgi:BirA family transcriptional regulator, biotin operon repressor / biotin---[acetyl-CoA-carboxylase] ligase
VSDLAPTAVLPLLRGAFGTPYLYAAETPSTQELVRAPELPEGAVAVAEHQTAGRGRTGRQWEDAEGRSLLCSVLLRPAGGPLPQLSLVVALAVAEAIEDVAALAPLVKWPNDLLLDGRKVAGILLEASGGAVIAGIGINVNQDASELPAGTTLGAVSMRVATGAPHDRGALLAALLDRLESAYRAWASAGLQALIGRLEPRNALAGRGVVVDGVHGTAGRLAADGRLSVRLDDGRELLVESGEVALGA